MQDLKKTCYAIPFFSDGVDKLNQYAIIPQDKKILKKALRIPQGKEESPCNDICFRPIDIT